MFTTLLSLNNFKYACSYIPLLGPHEWNNKPCGSNVRSTSLHPTAVKMRALNYPPFTFAISFQLEER